MTDYRIRAEEAAEPATTESPRPSSKAVKTSMTLPPSSIATLRDLADRTGTSMAEIVRRAVAMEKFLLDASDAGSRILIKDKGSNAMRELIIR